MIETDTRGVVFVNGHAADHRDDMLEIIFQNDTGLDQHVLYTFHHISIIESPAGSPVEKAMEFNRIITRPVNPLVLHFLNSGLFPFLVSVTGHDLWEAATPDYFLAVLFADHFPGDGEFKLIHNFSNDLRYSKSRLAEA